MSCNRRNILSGTSEYFNANGIHLDDHINNHITNSCHFLSRNGCCLTPNTEGISFTLSPRGILHSHWPEPGLQLRGYQIIQTEFLKLYILETQPGRTLKPNKKISIDNFDIFSCVNQIYLHRETPS